MEQPELQELTKSLQFLLVAFGFEVCLILFVFFLPLDEEDQAVDKVC